jgi:hypothetical protein
MKYMSTHVLQKEQSRGHHHDLQNWFGGPVVI